MGRKKAFNVKKKKYMKRGDWIALAVFAAVAAVAAALVFGNFGGYIKVKDGIYQIKKDWIAADYGTADAKRYKKIGTVGDVAGYALTGDSVDSLIKYYKPDAPGAISSVYVGGSSRHYAAMADFMNDFVRDQYAAEAREPVPLPVAGRDAAYITYVIPGKADADGDKLDSSTPDTFVATAYVHHDAGHCAFIQVNCKGGTLTPEEIAAAMTLFGEALHLDGAK